MGADYFESDEDVGREGSIPVGIGEGTVIDGAIVDKNCRIGKAVRIINESHVEDSDPADPLCVIRDGIACVIKGVSLPDGWDLKTSVQAQADS